MSKAFYTNIDLKKNQLLNAIIQNLATPPDSPFAGQIYFDTNVVPGVFKIYNGSEWVTGGMTATTLGALINNMAALTIADGDLLTAADVSASNVAKKLTVLELYNAYKTKFDLVYMPKVTAATAYNKDYSTTVADIKMNGTQALGVADTLPRADHVHPTDTTRAASDHGHALTGIEITGILPLTKGGTGVNVASVVALLNSFGFLAATCSTAAATVAKTVTAAGFVLQTGAVVGILFSEAVPASATLNINATGAKAIKVDGAAIGATDIRASKFALLQYDGTAWNLLNHASTATTGNVQSQLNLLAPKASPALTGTPTAPTPAASDDSTKIATTAFVMRQIPITAPAETIVTIGDLIASATAITLADADMFGVSDADAGNDLKKITWTNLKAAIKTYTDDFYSASAHTHSSLTNSGFIASLPTLTKAETIALVSNIPTAYTSNPAMNGATASPGSSGSWSKGDHVHPVDTSRAPNSHVGTGGTSEHPLAVAEATDATPAKAGFMSGYEKYKLDGIEAGAQVNTVTSVAGRTGAVTLTKTDVGLENVTNNAQIKKLGSTPAVGNVPTWVSADELAAGYGVETTLVGSSTKLARADAIKNYIDTLLAGADAMIFKGTVGTGGTHTIAAFNALTVYNAGWTYKIITAGTIKGKVCEVGDMLVATVDRSSAGVDADWAVIQTNIDGAVTGPSSAGNLRIAVFNGTTGKIIKDGGKTIAELSLAGHNHDSVYPKKVSGNFGIANTSAYLITHNLGTTDIIVSLWDNLTGEQIDADVVKTNTTQITVTINPVSATFPATDQFRVVVIG